MRLESQVLAWDRENMSRLNWSIGCQPHLDNWISNDNTHINKQLRKNLRRFFFTQKDPTLSHKIKDNVRMDSIIAL
jgi:hypothetical protein